MLVAPIHECLDAEMEQYTDTCIRDFTESAAWHNTFEEHPFRHLADDPRPVYPLALYCDGVRYTRATQMGKNDSLINFTCHNLATGKRHLIACASKRELCKCGCRGWCSMYPIKKFISWSLECAARGVRQAVDWDGSPRPAGRQEPLKARYIMVDIKGDWSEHCSTFGFTTWSAFHRPCPFCKTSKNDMFFACG